MGGVLHYCDLLCDAILHLRFGAAQLLIGTDGRTHRNLLTYLTDGCDHSSSRCDHEDHGRSRSRSGDATIDSDKSETHTYTWHIFGGRCRQCFGGRPTHQPLFACYRSTFGLWTLALDHGPWTMDKHLQYYHRQRYLDFIAADPTPILHLEIS